MADGHPDCNFSSDGNPADVMDQDGQQQLQAALRANEAQAEILGLPFETSKKKEEEWLNVKTRSLSLASLKQTPTTWGWTRCLQA